MTRCDSICVLASRVAAGDPVSPFDLLRLASTLVLEAIDDLSLDLDRPAIWRREAYRAGQRAAVRLSAIAEYLEPLELVDDGVDLIPRMDLDGDSLARFLYQIRPREVM